MTGIVQYRPGSTCAVVPVHPKPKNSRHAWRGRVVEDPAFRTWARGVTLYLRAHRPPRPLEGPLEARYTFVLPRPIAMRQPLERVWHHKRPDAENLSKALNDCLQEAGWFLDDGQIAVQVLGKMYAAKGEQPCIELELAPLPPPR